MIPWEKIRKKCRMKVFGSRLSIRKNSFGDLSSVFEFMLYLDATDKNN